MISLLSEQNPLLITDLTRLSIFRSYPDAEKRVNDGIQKDGSSRGAIVLDDQIDEKRFGFADGDKKLCVQLGKKGRRGEEEKKERKERKEREREENQ
jgi:hypothetical protein